MKKLLVKIALSAFLMVFVLFGVRFNQPQTANNEKIESSIISLNANNVMLLASDDGIAWPGSTETSYFDTSSVFSEDSSGLDFHNNQLYVVENGDGILWILDVAKNGSLTFADGYKDGKKIKFKSNAESSKGVDVEGVTVDGDGWVYVCTERDLAKDGTSNCSIIKLNAKSSDKTLIGVDEWNLTSDLPKSGKNEGLEAVEWVSNSELEGKLYDKNTKKSFDSSNYPKQTAQGVFFVGLESNGHVYGYILNNDGSFVQIADIDAGFGCVMALDYDVSEDVLWIVTDDNEKNISAQVVFNGEEKPSMTNVKPIPELNDNEEGVSNFEGFV